MIGKKVLGGVVVTLAMFGCGPTWGREESGCSHSATGIPGLSVRLATVPSFPSSRHGALVVRVRHGVPELPPIDRVSAGLYPDTTLRSTFRTTSDAVSSAVTDELGWTVIDSIPAGRYGLMVRRLGYDAIRKPVTVRAGFADTLDATMRRSPLCLTLLELAT